MFLPRLLLKLSTRFKHQNIVSKPIRTYRADRKYDQYNWTYGKNIQAYGIFLYLFQSDLNSLKNPQKLIISINL